MEKYLKLKVGDIVKLLYTDFSGVRTGETAKVTRVHETGETFSINNNDTSICYARPQYWKIVQKVKRKKFYK